MTPYHFFVINLENFKPLPDLSLTLLHSEWTKLYGVLALLSATGLNTVTYITLRDLRHNRL